MTDVKPKNTHKTKIDGFSSISPNTSLDSFVNYAPKSELAQAFNSYRNRRGKGPNVHGGIDYGSRANITKGTPITAVMSGVATPIYNYYTANGVTDAAMVIRGSDSKGRSFKITIGHLTAESVKKIMASGTLNEKGELIVKPGDLVGLVGITGKTGGNEPHAHIKTEVNGKVVNPLEYFKDEYNSRLSMSKSKQDSRDDSKINEINVEPSTIVKPEHEKSIAERRYVAMASGLNEAGINERSSEWTSAIIQTAFLTGLSKIEVNDISQFIPNAEPAAISKAMDANMQNALT
jgi:hypothetical protein